MIKNIPGLLSSVVAFAMAFFPTASWSAPNIAVTIQPIHSLVYAITKNVTEPSLIIDPKRSPHHYALKPSDAKKLSHADIIFMISDDFERALVKPIKSLSANARVITLTDTKGLTLLPRRTNNLWQSNDHDHHDHHHESNDDLHIWLSPDNAIAMVKYITHILKEEDPAHSHDYQRNADRLIADIYTMDKALATQLEFYDNTPYLVLHDAYHYFEAHYGLNALGAISLSPEVSPGAKRIKQLKELIINQGVNCVFTEPQKRPPSIVFLAEQSGINMGELDPIGAGLPQGERAYFQMMQGLANSLATCFTDLRGNG